MKNIIFYFTGTGNSLAVARDIAGKMEDVKLMSIAKGIKEANIDLSPYDRIGFVIPVYYQKVPTIVKRFIEKLNFNKSQYIFAVVTLVGHYGTIFSELKHYILQRSGTLSAGFLVFMPGNYIIDYNAFPKIIQRIFFSWKNKKVIYISFTVREKKTLFEKKWAWFSGPSGILGIIKKSTKSVDKPMETLVEKSTNFNADNKCIGCALCEKICPVNNIQIKNKQPSWENQCERCMACIQWCPTQAIQYGSRTQKRNQYHNPEIKISDMISINS
ncbi:EFR1 family ferrodoxin [Clostridium sp. JS66]|uniref:EFR1 family ferrodoxin n=1 Tax=Clostridium sp. JS66 TaxID=3064705 RepID=UPI00298DD814|nr:EFR1 family ferrodoxin [Clostridium sp. JS66]WPC43721.1 EFR1 family ferrodoxin [Clostridium sp. JS66]